MLLSLTLSSLLSLTCSPLSTFKRSIPFSPTATTTIAEQRQALLLGELLDSIFVSLETFSDLLLLSEPAMDDYRRSHIPAFGNWDYANDLPITQYFESARQAGLIRYSSEERDLYVVDEFYGDDLKKPVKTAVSRRKVKGSERRYPTHVKEHRKQGRVCDVTEPPSYEQKPHPYPAPPKAPKAVDEDLYKIPPELLHNYPKRKKSSFFSCLMPACAA